MAAKLNEETIAEFREAFSLFSTGPDGTLPIDKLDTVMRSLGQNPTEEALRDIIYDYDENATGIIDFQTFLCIISRRMLTGGEGVTPHIHEIFDDFDRYRRGTLDVAEFRRGLKKAGCDFTDEAVDAMFRLADVGGNCQLAVEDFTNMIMASESAEFEHGIFEFFTSGEKMLAEFKVALSCVIRTMQARILVITCDNSFQEGTSSSITCSTVTGNVIGKFDIPFGEDDPFGVWLLHTVRRSVPGQTLHLVDRTGNFLHKYDWELEEDGAGTIPTEELGTIMRAMGLDPTEAEIQDVINEVDAGRRTRGSAQLLFSMVRKSEACVRTLFVAYVQRVASGGRPCFAKAFDRDGCGLASKADLREFIRQKEHVLKFLGCEREIITDIAIDDLFREVDVDADDLLSYEQFVKAALQLLDLDELLKDPE